MEHIYMIADGDLRILTPGVASMADVKNELIEHSQDRIVRKSIYPNGFEIVFEQQNQVVFLHCNRPLVKNEDGSFTAPTDK